MNPKQELLVDLCSWSAQLQAEHTLQHSRCDVRFHAAVCRLRPKEGLGLKGG